MVSSRFTKGQFWASNMPSRMSLYPEEDYSHWTVSGAAQCLKTSAYLHNIEGWFYHEFAGGCGIIR